MNFFRKNILIIFLASCLFFIICLYWVSSHLMQAQNYLGNQLWQIKNQLLMDQKKILSIQQAKKNLDILSKEKKGFFLKEQNLLKHVKKIALNHYLSDLKMTFIKEKKISSTNQFMIKCFTIRISCICKLDDDFFEFLKNLYYQSPGFLINKELSLEKIYLQEKTDLSDDQPTSCEIPALRGIYVFEWYILIPV